MFIIKDLAWTQSYIPSDVSGYHLYSYTSHITQEIMGAMICTKGCKTYIRLGFIPLVEYTPWIHQWTIHRPLLRDSRPREERKDSRRWTASVVTDERLLGWDRMWTGVNYPRISTKQFEFIEIIQNIWAFMGILLLNWFISGFGWFWKVLFRRSAVDWSIWSVHRWFSTRS